MSIRLVNRLSSLSINHQWLQRDHRCYTVQKHLKYYSRTIKKMRTTKSFPMLLFLSIYSDAVSSYIWSTQTFPLPFPPHQMLQNTRSDIIQIFFSVGLYIWDKKTGFFPVLGINFTSIHADFYAREKVLVLLTLKVHRTTILTIYFFFSPHVLAETHWLNPVRHKPLNTRDNNVLPCNLVHRDSFYVITASPTSNIPSATMDHMWTEGKYFELYKIKNSTSDLLHCHLFHRLSWDQLSHQH